MERTKILEDFMGGQERQVLLLEQDDRASRVGNLALKFECLGINDPLSHLFQYMEKGEDSLFGIMEDLETDIAERLPNKPFVNYVDFLFTGSDFISSKDRVSALSMTSNNFEIIAKEKELDGGSRLAQEYERAEAELKEIIDLTRWFPEAKVGSIFVAESLPMDDQKVAVSRIYRKQSDEKLEAAFVSLFNPTIDNFVELRQRIGVDCDGSYENELELLRDSYELYSSTFRSVSEFLEYYVDVYDLILNKNAGGEVNYSFGLGTPMYSDIMVNGLEKVRKHNSLTSTYVDAIRTIAFSGNVVNQEVVDIAQNLGYRGEISVGDRISMEMARNLLRDVIVGIASVIDQAPDDVLLDINESKADTTDSYDVISYYKGQAESLGSTYSSNACPTYDRTTTDGSSGDGDSISEYAMLARAFNVSNLDNFGRPHMGVCRIPGCPSRGVISWLPNKTIVGGCSICAKCHKLFNEGKDPAKVYLKK